MNEQEHARQNHVIPYAAATTDHTGCEHIGPVERIEAVAASGANGPTEIVYLYTGPAPSNRDLSDIVDRQQGCAKHCEATAFRIMIRNRDAKIAYMQAQNPSPSTHVLPIELDGVSRALANEDGFWKSCSGCHELDEGVPTGPYSSVMKCHLGMGCSECGGIGAIWDTIDYEEMGRVMASETTAPSNHVTAVSREDTIKFLEIAIRNWSDVQELSASDIADVTTALQWFLGRQALAQQHGESK